DLLDETSQGRRLLPILGHLADSPDPQVSAKATLFIGRRVQSSVWAEQQLERDDERVRANAIESIWGLKTDAARAILDRCVDDASNRVAGNALVGLYVIGEPGIPHKVRQMASDPQPRFRATAAWAMGRMGDPAFSPQLTGLLKDD